MDLQYKEYIKSLATLDKNVVFFNSGPEHAALVMGTIFDNAQKYVKIYAGNFSGHISDKQEYKSGLENFLRRNGKLEILLQKDKVNRAINEHEPKIFELLRLYSIINPEQISIKLHPFHINKDNTGPEMHFTVADDKMYRIEDDIEKFTAIGNFNDPIIAVEMSNMFDKIFNSQEATSLPL